MRCNRLSAEIIAAVAMAMMPMANTANAISANPSTSTSPSIEDAARQEARIFKGYMAFLVVVGIGTAAWTFAVWRASNKYLDAVKADAERRIEEVKGGAKTESARIEREGKESIATLDAASKERIAQVESAANLKIAEANQRTAQLARDAEDLKKRNLETAANLEAERSNRLELEKSLAPRMMVVQSNDPKLTPFSDLSVIIEVMPDAEARRAAVSIVSAFGMAQFNPANVKVSTNPQLEAGFFDGVVISAHVPDFTKLAPPPPPKGGMTGAPASEREEYFRKRREYDEKERALKAEEVKMQEFANAVLEYLNSKGWQEVRTQPAVTSEIPPNTIRIQIGFKPTPYFLPPEMKKYLEERKEQQKDMMKRLREYGAPPPR
jgi:hypothetical protein